jgi:hypothetical protein
LSVQAGALLGDAGCGIGQEGREVLSERLAGSKERGQDSVQVAAGVLIAAAFGFGQVPGADVVDVAVGFVDDVPDRCGGPAEVEVRQSRVDEGVYLGLRGWGPTAQRGV